MSIDVQTVIRETCLYRGGEFAVLMAMADSANTGDGRGIYPGIDLLAANARQSIRQCQENIRTLRNDGVVILVDEDGEDCAPDVPAAGGRGKKTEYRIDLERVLSLHGLHVEQDEASGRKCEFCRAREKRLAKRVKSGARKGAVSDRKDAVSNTKGAVSGSAYIEPTNPTEPIEPTQRARAQDAAGAERRMKTGFARWFGEYRQAPNFKKTWTKDSARAAWERLGDDDPPDAQLIEAARRYVRWLKDQNAKRASNNPEPVHHPATWLMKRCWKGFLENETEKPDGGEHAEKLARFRKEFGEFADRLVASLTAPFCAEWLARCVLSSRAPPKIEASTPFIRNWLQMNARRKLEHIFGEDLIIEVQQQGKAAA